MENRSQDILKLLRQELEFLEKGGYKRSPRLPWRAPYIFEESPSCPNYSDLTRQQRCQDCWLMQFVPRDLYTEEVPCRFVHLTADGITVDSLYRFGSGAETEETLRTWLHRRIQEVEGELSDEGKLHLAS
ncbi:MAG TPA: hypothetical protein VHV29_17625 [Terriglobales bacterium]|jgi:hypothetical protein|nr:hypothetical protein [Terriglobales bacterium]